MNPWRDPRDVTCPEPYCAASVGRDCKPPPGVESNGVMVHAARIEHAKRYAQ